MSIMWSSRELFTVRAIKKRGLRYQRIGANESSNLWDPAATWFKPLDCSPAFCAQERNYLSCGRQKVSAERPFAECGWKTVLLTKTRLPDTRYGLPGGLAIVAPSCGLNYKHDCRDRNIRQWISRCLWTRARLKLCFFFWWTPFQEDN